MFTAQMIGPFVISAVIVLTRELLAEYLRKHNKLSYALGKSAIIATAVGLADVLLILIIFSYTYSVRAS